MKVNMLEAKNQLSRLVKYALAGEDVVIASNQTPLEGFLIMLHSTASKRAAKIGREQIEKGHQRILTSALGGRLAPERAALVLAIVAGVQVMRQMIALPALANASPKALVRLLTPIFQHLIEGTCFQDSAR